MNMLTPTLYSNHTLSYVSIGAKGQEESYKMGWMDSYWQKKCG